MPRPAPQPPAGHTWDDYAAWIGPTVKAINAAGHTAIVGIPPAGVTYQQLSQ